MKYTCKNCVWYVREKPLNSEQYYCMELMRERKKVIHVEAEQQICMAFEYHEKD